MFFSDINDWKALDAVTGSNPPNIEALCAAIARIMGVDVDGVGLLRVRGLSLEFIYPIALKFAGRIQLTNSAVAANTVTSKKAEIFNNFARVSHNSVFELVPLGDSAKTNTNQQRIQKLMSAPVVDSNRKTTGVVQISRKGRTRDEAGFDFTEEDLQNLSRIAQVLPAIFEKL